VLLAMPPADYLMHNTTFLVAHFHNMLIPGALFGYLAGYQYWFPKAFGFTLAQRWGKAAFWCWIIGFYLAFMPLYALGLMGMPRRLEHYNNAEWQPYLIVAAIGTVVILVGLTLLVVQLVVSVRQCDRRRDTTGDPWQSRTLEWLTSSPPPSYNFAIIPEVRDRDAFYDMKQRRVAYDVPRQYYDIHMPTSTAAGVMLGGAAFVLGFAMVAHLVARAPFCFWWSRRFYRAFI